ncbi:unnamed protein product [Closterium sp. NIES-54]
MWLSFPPLLSPPPPSTSHQISNRVLCIKNHLLLAGLLSRTLIVPFHHSEVVRNYNMHVALDVEHLRRCFGKVVFTTAEYRRKYVKPINVTEVVCWHGPKGACREEDKELLLNCPAPETMNTPASVLVGGDGEALRKGACREEDKELLLNCPAPETMNTPASVLVGGDGEALRKVQCKLRLVFNTWSVTESNGKCIIFRTYASWGVEVL